MSILVIVVLALIVSPVSAKSVIDKREPDKRGPHRWDIDVTVYDPYIFDPEEYPDTYLGSFSFMITMPPVSWPVSVTILREGELFYEWHEPIYYEDTDLGFAGPIWEHDPPESITYTFILKARGVTVSKDVIFYFD